mgnify:CR=1 FL=1
MNREQVQEVLDKFAAQGNPPKIEGVEQWVDFLLEQDYDVAIKAAVDVVRNSNSAFWPAISEVNSKIKSVQKQISLHQSEVARKRGCKKCHGQTWLFDDPDGAVPCSSCRAATYKHWEMGDYELHATINTSDKNQYEKATPAETGARAKRCSPERTKQWVLFLEKSDEPGYPEDLADDMDMEI